MSATTKIEWTRGDDGIAGKTWNPVRGCSIVSPGCVNCYAMKHAHRFSGPGKPYEGLTKQTKAGPQWTGKVRLVVDALLEPLSWRKPRRVFVNSMSDLFHEAVPDVFIERVFSVMALAERHTFQVLTKRPGRMADWFRARRFDVKGYAILQTENVGECLYAHPWPLPNVWLGVSCENQQTADERIPLLLQTPAAVRFVSAEPLLGPIDFHSPVLEVDSDDYIDWVIVGGESGSGARPMDVAWARSIVRQCQAAQVPVFVKQLGSKATRPRVTLAAGAGVECKHGFDVCPTCDAGTVPLRDRKGGDPSEWPADLRVRQYPPERPHA